MSIKKTINSAFIFLIILTGCKKNENQTITQNPISDTVEFTQKKQDSAAFFLNIIPKDEEIQYRKDFENIRKKQSKLVSNFILDYNNFKNTIESNEEKYVLFPYLQDNINDPMNIGMIFSDTEEINFSDKKAYILNKEHFITVKDIRTKMDDFQKNIWNNNLGKETQYVSYKREDILNYFSKVKPQNSKKLSFEMIYFGNIPNSSDYRHNQNRMSFAVHTISENETKINPAGYDAGNLRP